MPDALSVASVVQWLAVPGALAALGTLAAVIAAGLRRGEIDSLRGENDTIRRRLGDLLADAQAKGARIDALEHEVERWRDAAGSANVARELSQLAIEVRAGRDAEHAAHLELAKVFTRRERR